MPTNKKNIKGDPVGDPSSRMLKFNEEKLLALFPDARDKSELLQEFLARYTCAKIREDLMIMLAKSSISQSTLAKRMHMTPSAVNQFLHSDGDMRIGTLTKMAAAVGFEPIVSFSPMKETMKH